MMEEVAELWGADVREEEIRDRVEMMLRRGLGSDVMELVGGFLYWWFLEKTDKSREYSLLELNLGCADYEYGPQYR